MVSQTRDIRIRVTTTGEANLKKVSRELGTLNKNVARTQKNLQGFSTFFQAAFALGAVRQITRFSDEIQILRDRIKVFSDSGEEAERTFQNLVKAASLTNTSVSSLGEIFNRLALSTKELGLSNDAIIAGTVALQDMDQPE